MYHDFSIYMYYSVLSVQMADECIQIDMKIQICNKIHVYFKACIIIYDS